MTAAPLKLHEVVAIRKGVKARTYGDLTVLHKQSQKAELFNGLTKEFKPKDADGETFPAESKPVQLIYSDVLKKVAKLRTEFYDIEATLECGNQNATADVEVDGVVILSKIPATLLIMLEKDLNDLYTVVESMPTLDDAKLWTKDPNGKTFRSETGVSHKTAKVQEPLVLYPATPEHPAQTQIITKDVVVGHWHTTHISGAMPIPEKEALLERLDKMRQAVKRARSRANDTEIERKQIGEAVLGFLFR